jgi:hyperosmotically inducible protein
MKGIEMSRKKLVPTSLIILAFAAALTACRPAQTVERQTNDAAIEARIKSKLATDVGAATITSVEVNVTNGVVTLAGPVSTAEERQKIEAVARAAEGVTSVTNNIQVTANSAPAPQAPSTSAPSTSTVTHSPGGSALTRFASIGKTGGLTGRFTTPDSSVAGRRL